MNLTLSIKVGMSRITREMITRKIMVHDTYPRMSDAVASAGTSLVVSLAGRRGYTVKFQSQLFSNGILNCKKVPDIIKLLNSTEKQKQCSGHFGKKKKKNRNSKNNRNTFNKCTLWSSINLENSVGVDQYVSFLSLVI